MWSHHRPLGTALGNPPSTAAPSLSVLTSPLLVSHCPEHFQLQGPHKPWAQTSHPTSPSLQSQSWSQQAMPGSGSIVPNIPQHSHLELHGPCKPQHTGCRGAVIVSSPSSTWGFLSPASLTAVLTAVAGQEQDSSPPAPSGIAGATRVAECALAPESSLLKKWGAKKWKTMSKIRHKHFTVAVYKLGFRHRSDVTICKKWYMELY